MSDGDMRYDIGARQQEWQSRWEALEPDLVDDSEEALPEAVRLIDEMASGLEMDASTALEEVSRDLMEARDVARRLDAGEALSAEELEGAVDAVRELYADMIEDHRGWGGVLGTEPPQRD